jgi:integrase
VPLRIYKRGGVYHCEGTIGPTGNRRRIRSSLHTSDEDTAARQAAEIEAGFWKGHFDGPQSILTFARAAKLYRAAGKPTDYLDRIEKHLEGKLVKDIKPGTIREMALDLYPSASNATRNRQAIVPCQAVINYAANDDLCSHIRVKRFKVDKKIKQPFTLDWVDKFCQNAVNPYVGALVLFMFATGARVSEALAVQWEHVNLKERTALIPRSKISEQRIVHLPPRLVAALANLVAVKDRPVFWYRRCGDYARAWDRTIERAGIKRMTPHSGRHGFATASLRKRIDPKTAAWLGGWKSIRHFMETYAHEIQDITLNQALFDADAPLPQSQAAELKNVDKTGTS